MGRYSRRGQERVYFCATIASEAAPTVAEITAGVRLDTVMRSLSGFSFSANDLDASDKSSTFAKTIPGNNTAEDSSMELYDGDDDADVELDVKVALEKGTNGFVVFVPRGAPVAADPASVFPVRVKARNDNNSADEVTATYTVGFSIPDEPSQDAVIAA